MMKNREVFFQGNIKALCLLILFSFAGCATIAKTATGVSSSDKVLKGKLIQREEMNKLNIAVVPFAEKRGRRKATAVCISI